jgi:hypothetical protein
VRQGGHVDPCDVSEVLILPHGAHCSTMVIPVSAPKATMDLFPSMPLTLNAAENGRPRRCHSTVA